MTSLVWGVQAAEFGVDGRRGCQLLLYLPGKKPNLPFPADGDSVASREVLVPARADGAKHIFVLLGMCFLKGSFYLQ